MKPDYQISEDRIANINCHRIDEPLLIDGNLEKSVWKRAEKSRRFVDLVNGEQAFLDTRAAALWDDKALYIGFWIEEPVIRASLTERDSLIWFDNDVEVFFGGEDCYYEFEINAYGTIYEVFFIYQDALKKGSRFDIPQFDLYSRNVDVLSGFQDPARFKKHKRGRRWAFMDWDFPCLKSAVKIDGKINDPLTVSRGWTVELAFPWEGFKILSPGKNWPPNEGDSLRCQLFRFEALRYHGKTVTESAAWALNEHGALDSHIPENFACLHFCN
ncbi:MAG: carbohydrate-binding family 9-like protein [Treponema sp.]|nr:carbohydrate-binding family 9-like protein [Treponema sp.]